MLFVYYWMGRASRMDNRYGSLLVQMILVFINQGLAGEVDIVGVLGVLLRASVAEVHGPSFKIYFRTCFYTLTLPY